MSDREIAIGASSYRPVSGERSSTDGADITVGTTEGGPSINVTGFGKLDPLTC